MSDLTSSQTRPVSKETLQLIEAVLDYIRLNLSNIQKTWGPDSAQYKSATEIMQVYLTDNVKRMKGEVQDGEIEELMAGLSLEAEPKTTGKQDVMSDKT